MNSPQMMSWSDRFALIQHYQPTDAQVCAAFGLTQDELATARALQAAGTFRATPNYNVAKYADIFTTPRSQVAMVTDGTPGKKTTGTATSYARPETASKQVKVPQKRGRKGDKITTALSAVPLTQVPVEDFMKQHGVSLAVLRQSKRFMAKLDPAVVASIGTINVRQDKGSKTLMIWRTV